MLSERVKNLHPYIPGEQPKDRVYIKLNANENPYPPAPSVIVAMQNALSAHPEKVGLYPDPDAADVRASIAAMLNQTGGVLSRTHTDAQETAPKPDARDTIGFTVTPDMIFCGNGSDEVLSFVFYTFFESNRPLILPEHTYSFYPVYCGYYAIPLQKIPLTADWRLDTEQMIREAQKSQSSIIFANPNAPTGLSLSRSEVRTMLENIPQESVFVVDEAYCDFGGESVIPLLKDFKNLVVVRTFSKSFSLAGMRLGFIVAHPELIQAVFTAKNSFNHFPVDVVAQCAGIASCKAVSYYAQNARAIVSEREALSSFLRERGWFLPESCTNFVFCKNQHKKGELVYQEVKKAGILIRHFDTPGIEDFVRITIGTPEQMNALKDILGNL